MSKTIWPVMYTLGTIIVILILGVAWTKILVTSDPRVTSTIVKVVEDKERTMGADTSLGRRPWIHQLQIHRVVHIKRENPTAAIGVVTNVYYFQDYTLFGIRVGQPYFTSCWQARSGVDTRHPTGQNAFQNGTLSNGVWCDATEF